MEATGVTRPEMTSSRWRKGCCKSRAVRQLSGACVTNLLTANMYECTVWVKKNPTPKCFLTFFPKRLGIFSPSFIHLLNVPIYAGLQIVMQLSATLMKLCHIKRGHPVHATCSKCPPSAKTHDGIFWHFFKKTVGIFLVQLLHTYYAFLSTLDYKFLSNYLQLRRSYAILSATTQRAFQPMLDILSIMVVALNMA